VFPAGPRDEFRGEEDASRVSCEPRYHGVVSSREVPERNASENGVSRARKSMSSKDVVEVVTGDLLSARPVPEHLRVRSERSIHWLINVAVTPRGSPSGPAFAAGISMGRLLSGLARKFADVLGLGGECCEVGG
jgi:hypothetical protein